MAIWSLVLPESGQQLVIANAMPGSGLQHARQGGISRAASGAGSVDDMGPKRPRSWRLRFELLSQAERGLLYAAWLDGGAVWLIDPTQKNLMHPNVSTAGAAHRTVDGWTVTGGTVTRIDPVTIVPPVQMAHTISRVNPAAGENIDLGYMNPSAWDLYATLTPVVEPAEQYTFSVYAKIAAASPAQTIALKFTHYTIPGGSGVDDIGGNLAVTTAWQRYARTITMPAGKGRVWNGLVTGTGTTNTLHLTAPQLEKAAVASAWAPGQGPALVVITGYEEPYSYPRAEYTDADLTLEEIGGPL